jgi:hypothetical protein
MPKLAHPPVRLALGTTQNPLSFACMGYRSEAYRRRAEQCERAAARVRDPDIRSMYLTIALRWRRMAEQQEQIEALSEYRQP